MSKLTKEEKQQKKEYCKMLKKYKKIFKKDAWNAADDPFDYEPGMQLLIDHMQFMQEYYKIGWNIFAMEHEGRISRYESITAALKEYELGWNEFGEVVYQFFPKSSAGEYDIVDWAHPLNGLSKEEAHDAYQAALKEHKKKFFDILLEDQGYWWD